MTVKELIDYLATQPQHLHVVYGIHSEHCLLEADDIYVDSLCIPRPDGWVANKRPDKDTMEYLIFPAN